LERCHFEWLREAARRAEVHDPLLPAVPAPEADAALSQELVCAVADDQVQEAARIAVELRRGAMESEAVESPEGGGRAPSRSTSRPRPTTRRLDRQLPRAVGAVSVTRASLSRVKNAPLNHLRRAVRQAPSDACAGLIGSDKCAVVSGDPAREESRFHNEPVRMLLRYKTIGGSGFQAALGGGAAFAVLRR